MTDLLVDKPSSHVPGGSTGPYQLTEDSYRENLAATATQSWAGKLLAVLESRLASAMPSPQGLGDNTAKALLTGVAAFVAKRLELGLRKLRSVSSPAQPPYILAFPIYFEVDLTGPRDFSFSQLGGLQLDKDIRIIVTWFTARCVAHLSFQYPQPL